ncbi:sialate O-acetylesterase [Neptunicella sp. SCSIO 80796]|uniref:sialate O-acetylesterase n=1 Tax=Neptunicella plasticusilytica TaxID=3117012 RepID=UPI003A4D627E
MNNNQKGLTTATNWRRYAILLLSILAGIGNVQAQVNQFAAVFADNMLLQRDQPLSVWGSAQPDSKLTVTIGDVEGATQADAQGYWSLTFPANDLPDAFDISVKDEQGNGQTLSNVVYGDLWLCSGQSNMDLKVRKAAYPDRTAKEANLHDIRIMKVGRQSTAKTGAKLQVEIPWSQANQQSLPEFSSICWEMALEMQKHTQRPLGLVQAAWGGTTIEDWISPQGLRDAGEQQSILTLLELYASNQQQATQQVLQDTKQWASKFDQGITASTPWYTDKLDEEQWQNISMPVVWERSDIEELSNFNGVIWFRKHFEVQRGLAKQEVELRLGRINERDTVWINGQHIADTLEASTDRIYTIFAGVLRPGENTLAIRAIDERGSGGFSAYPGRFGLRWDGKELVSLNGMWQYRISADIRDIDTPPVVPWSVPRGFTTLYNGMIAPLGPLTLKGVAWYQGESNTGFDKRYAKLLPAMIKDWRKQFNAPQLPFVVAQLPVFGQYKTDIVASKWAELRGAQQHTAQSDPKVGMAVLLDRGLPNDIHPSHKKEPGRRMAIEALRVAYNDASQPVSPYPQSIQRSGKDILVNYPPNSGDLQLFGGSVAIGFQLCRDNSHCVFKPGQVEGHRVRLVDVNTDATRVKYAWEDSPIVNLFGQGDLPAAPFNLVIE